MSSATFDPNKIRIEDIFRAKEERRQHLAKLPLEEKIKILRKLQTGVAAAMKNEKLIFEAFLKACPDFANEPIQEWDVVGQWYGKRSLASPSQPFDKRPDIVAVTASGKKIGVELESWVNRDQIREARKQERIRENILKAIGKQPPNETKHIGYVRLDAKQVRFDPRDALDFRAQLFGLIEKRDSSWPQDRYFRDHEYPGDLTAFPVLGKYLASILCEPSAWWHPDGEWIGFPSRGGSYSPNEMLETLSSALLAHRSDDRYKDLRTQVGLDEVYLLVHYDFKAFVYNTPFDAPNFGFREAAEFASTVLGGDGGNFDRIFLFHFLWGEEKAQRIL